MAQAAAKRFPQGGGEWLIAMGLDANASTADGQKEHVYRLASGHLRALGQGHW